MNVRAVPTPMAPGAKAGRMQPEAASRPAKAATKSATPVDTVPRHARRMVAGVDDRVPLLFCTVEQAAYALGIKARFAWALVAKGDRGDPDGLHAVRLGLRLRRVPMWEIQRYARSLAGEGEAAATMPDAQISGAHAWTPSAAPLTPLLTSGRGG